MPDQREAPIGEVLRSALDDVRELFREELALARAELRQEMGKARAGGVQLGGAAVALWFAAMFLLAAMALGISAMFDWPAWAGFAVVAVLLAIGGMVLVSGGRRAIREMRPLPRTTETLKENFR